MWFNGVYRRQLNKSEVKFTMTEKGKQILDLFEKIVPNLSDVEIEKLLAFGEGMAFKVQQEKQSPINQEQKPA